MVDIRREKSLRPLLYRDLEGLDYGLIVLQLLLLLIWSPFILLYLPLYLVGRFIIVPLLDRFNLWRILDW